MLKKLLLFLCPFLLVACSLKETASHKKQALNAWMEETGRIKVLATTAMIADVVKQVGGEHIDMLTLIEGDLDPHSYQLVKGDAEKFERADVVFYNGLGLEHGPSLQNHLKHNPKAEAYGDYIAIKAPEKVLHHETEVDPHIWMDISLWKEGISLVIEKLSLLDPEHTKDYQANGAALHEHYSKEDLEVFTLLQQIPKERRYLVTSHDAFNYFTRHYLADEEELHSNSWEKRFNAPEGLSPDSQLSSFEISSIIDHVERHQIHTLFTESNLSRDSIEKIIQAGRGKGLELKIAKDPLYGDAMGPEGSPGETYLGMIRHNAKIIYNELQ